MTTELERVIITVELNRLAVEMRHFRRQALSAV